MEGKKHPARSPSTSTKPWKGKRPGSGIDLDGVSVAMLSLFATEHRRLEQFLDASGLSLGAFREAAADGSLRAGLLDYLLGDDDLLIQIAATIQITPDGLAAALHGRLAEPERD